MNNKNTENVLKNKSIDKKIFNKYEELLKKWQKAINLVSPKTLNNVWERHFEDSLYLYDFIKDKKNIIDIGSGAGFPAMVLAIAGNELKEKNFPNICLIESDERKCFFLNEIKRAYNLDDKKIGIKNERIENLKNQTNETKNYITGRAFAPLCKFISLCKNIITKETEMYLLKGDNITEEITDAKKYWNFNYIIYKKENGTIIKIWNINKI